MKSNESVEKNRAYMRNRRLLRKAAGLPPDRDTTAAERNRRMRARRKAEKEAELARRKMEEEAEREAAAMALIRSNYPKVKPVVYADGWMADEFGRYKRLKKLTVDPVIYDMNDRGLMTEMNNGVF